MKIERFNFEQSDDLETGFRLKSMEIEFSFNTYREKLAFIWRVLTRKKIIEKSLFADGVAFVNHFKSEDL